MRFFRIDEFEHRIEVVRLHDHAVVWADDITKALNRDVVFAQAEAAASGWECSYLDAESLDEAHADMRAEAALAKAQRRYPSDRSVSGGGPFDVSGYSWMIARGE